MHGWGPASPGSLRTREIAGRRQSGGLRPRGCYSRGGRFSTGGCWGGALREEECAAAYAGGGGQLLPSLLPLLPQAADGWLREEELGPSGAGTPPGAVPGPARLVRPAGVGSRFSAQGRGGFVYTYSQCAALG